MDRKPGERIFGVETEYGCLVQDPSIKPEYAVEWIKDYVFEDLKLGLIDLHSRDEVFEPAESGGFLLNGGRLYIDAVGSHLEYATAECRTLKDLVTNDRGGQKIITRALKELNLQDDVSIYNNSVDHFGGHTFGCHENYLVQMSEDFFSEKVQSLLPFLITRQIFAGIGRVGGHVLAAGGRPDYDEMMANPIDYIWVSQVYDVFPDSSVPFQLSQRADHILKTVASRVRFNRALINPKWEHFYAHEGMHRLHLLFGEANQNEYAYALKVGTTSIVLQLLEDGLLEGLPHLDSPLMALREVSRDQTYKWIVCRDSGKTVRSIDIQREYLALAQRYRGSTPDVDWVLTEWERMLNDLECDPLSTGDRVDWVAKRGMVAMYAEAEDLPWTADALHSVDLEYHNIDPERSLYTALAAEQNHSKMTDSLSVVEAMTDAPLDTRAHGRSKLVRQILDRKPRGVYAFDWSGVSTGRMEYIEMTDPFNPYDHLSLLKN